MLDKEKAMKTIVTAAVLALVGLGGAAGADAQEHRSHPSGGGQHRDLRAHRHRVERVEHAPRLERIWIAPRYETVFAGYDHCGKPLVRTVCISEGRWTTRPVCD
jgi:hypothetical protein